MNKKEKRDTIHYGGGSKYGYAGTGIVRPVCGASDEDTCYNTKKDVTCKECIKVIKGVK